MSTKIWEAYRLKKDVNLWEFLRDVRLKAEKRVKVFLAEWIMNVIEESYNSTSETKTKLNEVLGYVPSSEAFDTCKAAQYWWIRYRAEKFRDPCISGHNFDVSISIRECDGRFYIIPHDCIGSLKFLRRDKRLEDFHYQDQSDRPERISNREWENRRRIWNKILDNHPHDVVYLEILSLDNWYRVNPSTDKFMRKIYKEFLARIN